MLSLTQSSFDKYIQIYSLYAIFIIRVKRKLRQDRYEKGSTVTFMIESEGNLLLFFSECLTNLGRTGIMKTSCKAFAAWGCFACKDIRRAR